MRPWITSTYPRSLSGWRRRKMSPKDHRDRDGHRGLRGKASTKILRTTTTPYLLRASSSKFEIRSERLHKNDAKSQTSLSLISLGRPRSGRVLPLPRRLGGWAPGHVVGAFPITGGPPPPRRHEQVGLIRAATILIFQARPAAAKAFMKGLKKNNEVPPKRPKNVSARGLRPGGRFPSVGVLPGKWIH